MSKHTPGPWWFRGEDKELAVIGSGCGTVAVFEYEPDEEDACLIAAAPDLLEAAKLALKAVPPPGCPNQAELGSCTHCDAQEHAIKTLQAAIAKAEGRP